MPDPLEHFKKAQSLLDKASLEIRAGMALIGEDEEPDEESPVTGLHIDLSNVSSWRNLPVVDEAIRVPYQATERGSNRVVHNVDLAAAWQYTLSYDVLFEDGWSFKTKGDGNSHHKDTGYPFQTGKLHGLGSKSPTTGRGAPEPDQWTARVIWQRNVHTHKPAPTHPPIDNNQPFEYSDDVCLGVTYYGQDRNRQGESGRFLPSDFANIKTQNWYKIELSVRLGEPNQSNDQIALIITDLSNGKVVGGLNILQLNLRESGGDIETFMFNTFFGGTSEPFSPVNELQHARFRNIEVTEGFVAYHGSDEVEEPGPEQPEEPGGDWKPSFDVVVGDVKGCYNIHGITDDESLDPPSVKESDWEIITDTHTPVVHHTETVGGRKIDPVGFYLTKSGLNLFYNSGWDNYDRWFELREERGYRGATNQAGSLFAFNDDFSQKKEHPESPVLDQPQLAWQGRNRVNPYALVYHEIEKQFYCFYGDFAEGGDCDKYKGRRALGCAVSKDMVNWEYLSVDRPMLDIKDVYDLDSDPFPNNNFCSQGRLYAFGATWQNNQIYLNVGGSIDGTSWSTIIRSREPMNYWKPVGEGGRPMAIRVKGKWYRPQNVGTPGGGRGIAIAVSDKPDDRGKNHLIFDTGHGGSAGTSRQLFAYKGKWHVAYRQRDEKQWAENREDYRDMYIAKEK